MILTILSACATIALGQVPDRPVQIKGYKLKPFKAWGSDGKQHDLKSLGAGKPVFLVNFYLTDGRQGVADMARLARMMRGKVRLVGLQVEPYWPPLKRRRPGFLLVDSGELLDQLRDSNAVLYGLSNALLLPDGRVTHLWYGYNRWTLKQMALDARKYAGIRLKLNLSKFPEQLQLGGAGASGLGGR